MWRETALLDKMQVLHWFSWDFTRRVELSEETLEGAKITTHFEVGDPKCGPVHVTSQRSHVTFGFHKRQASSVRFSWTRQVLHSAPEPSTQPKGSHCSSLFRRYPATVCRRKFEENWSNFIKLHVDDQRYGEDPAFWGASREWITEKTYFFFYN